MSEGEAQTPIHSESLGKALAFMDLHSAQEPAAGTAPSKSSNERKNRDRRSHQSATWARNVRLHGSSCDGADFAHRYDAPPVHEAR